MMEFKISLVEELANAGASPATSGPASSAPASSSPPSQQSAAQPPAVPIPQLQALQQTLLPALAAAAPQMARKLYADADHSAVTMPPLEPLAESRKAAAEEIRPQKVPPLARTESAAPPPAEGMARFYHGGHIRPGEENAPRWLSPDLAYAQGYAEKSGGPVHFVDIPETSPHLRKAFEDEGTSTKAPFINFEAPGDIARQLRLYEAMAEARSGQAPMPTVRRDNPDLDEAFGFASAAKAQTATTHPVAAEEMGKVAGEAIVQEILPPLEELLQEMKSEAPTEAIRPQSAEPEQTAPQEIRYSEQMQKPPVRRPGAQAGEAEAGAVEEGAMAGAAEESALAEVGAAGEMAAAGPVGIAAAVALVTVEEGAKAAAVAFDTARKAVTFLGEEAVAVAGNNYIGAFSHALEAGAAALKPIPVVGEALSAGLRLAEAGVIAFTSTVESFIQRGKELARYSPELSAANARAEIRSMIADMHEADALGPELARLTDNWTDLLMEMREMMLPIKEMLAHLLNEIMDWLKEHMGAIKEGVADIAAFLELLPEMIKALTPFSGVSIQDYVSDLHKEAKRILDQMKKPDDKDFVDNVKGIFDIQAPEAIGHDAARAAVRNNPLVFDGIMDRNIGF